MLQTVIHPGRTEAPAAASGQLLRALANAPVGPYPLLEASFGWSERRPAGWRNVGPAPLQAGGARSEVPQPTRYVPLMETTAPEAATRLVRLLPTMTWAVVTPAGDRPDGLTLVEAPAGSYHRTLRTLSGAWRDCQRLMSDPAAAARNRPVAVSLWRMAMLVGGQDLSTNTIVVRVTCARTALVLVTAATGLGLTPTVRTASKHSSGAVLITQRNQVARLRAEVVDPRSGRGL
jgi:hypothetical protein